MRLVSGATILRKGDPALILNVFDVFQDARFREPGLAGETVGEHESLLAISPPALQDRHPFLVVELDRSEVDLPLVEAEFDAIEAGR